MPDSGSLRNIVAFSAPSPRASRSRPQHDRHGPRGPLGGDVLRPARPGTELLLVLGVSLGQSAVYSILSLADSLTRAPLNQQTQTLNPAQDDRAVFDLIYQLLGIASPLVPVLLALYLMGPGVLHRIGLDLRRPRFDLPFGVLIAACIGVPGSASTSARSR